MNERNIHSHDEDEYKAFLKHIREEKDYTSNFAKSLLTFVLGVCCVIGIGLWLIQNESYVVGVFGENSIISQEFTAICGKLKTHKKNVNNWSIFGRQQNILLLGVDSNGVNTDPWKGTRSDTIILINVDPCKHSVNAISIPRDSKVYISGKYGVDKINSAHAYGGIDMAKRTIEDTLGVKINHYICIHDEGVREIINTLGGIPIYVEKRMRYDDFAANLHINLEKGHHILSGQQAVGYLRYRHDGLGDIGRTHRQQWFLRGFLDRMKSPQSIAKIPQIVSTAKKYIKTDMSVYELSQLAALAKNLDDSDIQIAMLPGAPNSKSGASYWILDPDKVQDVVNRLIYRENPPADKSAQLIGGILYTSAQTTQAKILKTQLNNLGYTVNMVQSSGLPHTQFIAHNGNVSDSFYKFLKEKIPLVAKTQYVYDPIRLFCAGNCDFTIVLSGK